MRRVEEQHREQEDQHDEEDRAENRMSSASLESAPEPDHESGTLQDFPVTTHSGYGLISAPGIVSPLGMVCVPVVMGPVIVCPSGIVCTLPAPVFFPVNASVPTSATAKSATAAATMAIICLFISNSFLGDFDDGQQAAG